MKTLGKVLIFLVIGFFFQLVIIFIALQSEGDISGAGKGTYAIPYILCYVFAWIIVFKRKFPKFLFEENNEKPKEEIIQEIKQEIKEVPKQEVNEQLIKRESVSFDSSKQKGDNSFPIFLIIIGVVALVVIYKSSKTATSENQKTEIKNEAIENENDIFKTENIFKQMDSSYFGTSFNEFDSLNSSIAYIYFPL